MVEALSADGSACEKLETSKVAPLSGWFDAIGAYAQLYLQLHSII